MASERTVTDLKPGDKVRLTHENGSVIESEVREGGYTGVLYIDVPGGVGYLQPERWEERGWTIEKIAPPLPTEPGVYIAGCHAHAPQVSRVWKLHERGDWSEPGLDEVDWDALEKINRAFGLVRLVPEVTE